MPTHAYDRLSFLDNSFLMMETPTSPMHVTGTATFESGPLRTADGGIDIDKIRDYVASRLHLIPRYRQRLAYVLMKNHPVWVDDEHFNIDYHVRHLALLPVAAHFQARYRPHQRGRAAATGQGVTAAVTVFGTSSTQVRPGCSATG